MVSLFRAVLFCCLLSLATLPLRAQFIQLGATGCPVSTAPTTSGNPRLGNVISVTCPGCSVGQASFVAIGACAPAPYWAFYPPLACTIGPCYVAVTPIWATVMPAYFTANIPFNQALVGASFCLQCGCVGGGMSCVRVWTALQIRIQS